MANGPKLFSIVFIHAYGGFQTQFAGQSLKRLHFPGNRVQVTIQLQEQRGFGTLQCPGTLGGRACERVVSERRDLEKAAAEEFAGRRFNVTSPLK